MVLGFKNKIVFVSACHYCFLWLLCSFFSISAAAEDVSPAYSLGYGDVVSIKVYGEEDLSVETQLNDVGVISFPFLGEIKVHGLTVTEVQDLVAAGLKEGYLVEPEVSVSVTQYRRFYVNGEVKQPGGFAFLPGLTVRKAISLAGGFTPRAAESKIYIISDKSRDASPRRVELNTSVNPGDVITVKQRFF
jgi:polysaccharide biosynthesis/export protein VpsN